MDHKDSSRPILDDGLPEYLQQCATDKELDLSDACLTTASLRTLVQWLRDHDGARVYLPLRWMWLPEFVLEMQKLDALHMCLEDDRIRLESDKEGIARSKRAIRKALEGDYLSFAEEFPDAGNASQEQLHRYTDQTLAEVASMLKQQALQIDARLKPLERHVKNRSTALEDMATDFVHQQALTDFPGCEGTIERYGKLECWSQDGQLKEVEVDGLLLLGSPVRLVIIVEAKSSMGKTQMDECKGKLNKFREYVTKCAEMSPAGIAACARKFKEKAIWLGDLKDYKKAVVVASEKMSDEQVKELCQAHCIPLRVHGGYFKYATQEIPSMMSWGAP